MNQVILVGTVKEKPEFRESSAGNRFCSLLIEVDRSFRNAEGGTDKDVFQVTMWRNLAEECEKNIDAGMSIGIKGRLSASNYLSDGKARYRCEIIAEKMTVYRS